MTAEWRPATGTEPAGDLAPVLRRPAAAPEFVARNEAEDLLVAALDQDDLDTVLKALLVSPVVAPVADDTPASAAVWSAEFRWRIYRDGNGPCVPLFTAASRCDESLGPVPTRLLEGLDAVTAWPDPGVALVLDPGTAIEVVVPGQAVIELAQWAAGIGMAELRSRAPAPAPAAAVRAASPPLAPAPGVALQLPIPGQHVAYYLQRGYDMVSGWAYPLERVGPQAGYALRWVWTGHGPYAADDRSGRVRVTGARLPHGAELRQLDQAGGDAVIASYDADLRQWRPVQGGA